MFKELSRPAQGLVLFLVSSHYSLHTEDPTVWVEGLMSILKGISPDGVGWRSSEAQGTGDLPFARKKPLDLTSVRTAPWGSQPLP